MTLPRARYLELLAADAEALAAAAAEVDLAAPAPSCPGWTVRDAVEHTAEVYEHKLACIAAAGSRPDPWPPEWPPDRDPLAWVQDALDRLLHVLGTTDPAAPSWTWWPADQTAGFWVRRMAQETAVHRVDVQLAAGTASPVDDDLAVDGMDELLHLMLAGDWTGDEEPELTGTTTLSTTGRTWTVAMSADRVDVSEAAGSAAEADVSADPSPLLLWSYGRVPDEAVRIVGDAAAAARLRARLALATQ